MNGWSPLSYHAVVVVVVLVVVVCVCGGGGGLLLFRAAPRRLAPSPVRVRPELERALFLVDVPVELALAAAEVDEDAAVQRALLGQRRVVERAPAPRAQRQARRVAPCAQAERRACALHRRVAAATLAARPARAGQPLDERCLLQLLHEAVLVPREPVESPPAVDRLYGVAAPGRGLARGPAGERVHGLVRVRVRVGVRVGVRATV